MEFESIDTSVFLELGGGEGRIVWNEYFIDILPNPDSDTLVFTMTMSDLLLFNENKKGKIQSLNLRYYPIELDSSRMPFIIQSGYLFVRLGRYIRYASTYYCDIVPSKKRQLTVSQILSNEQIYKVLLIAAKKVYLFTFNHKEIWNLKT